MAVDPKILGIVWAETSRLVPADGSAAAKTRLQAVVGRLAEQAGRRGSTANFARPVSLPSVGTPGGDRADDMRNAVDAALTTDQSAGVRLPRRAVLWEVTGTGEPRETDLPLPTGATWIKEGSATRTSDFTVEGDRSRRLFRLYESDAEPRIDDTAYVSGLTYSGVPTGSSKINYLSLPWVVGIGAAVMFFWMIATLAWTGGSVNQAYDLMRGRQPTHTAAFLDDTIKACGKSNSAGIPPCKDVDLSGATPAEAQNKAKIEIDKCLADDAQQAPMQTSSFCRLAWATALGMTSSTMTDLPEWGGKIVSTLLGWGARVSERLGSISIAAPMALLILSIALLGMALGQGIKGSVFGIWISPQNRMSLARMQVTLWTIVVLGAYAAIASFNIGMLAEPIRDAAARDPDKIPASLVTFPGIPAMILAALGIAVVSPMISALIKGGGGVGVDLQDLAQKTGESGIGRYIDPAGKGEKLEVRPSPGLASLADFFTGETEADKNLIDVSRLQNVVITFILVFGYATLLFGMVRDVDPGIIIRGLHDNQSIFPTLPDPGGIFVTLLAASHATYLIAKKAST